MPPPHITRTYLAFEKVVKIHCQKKTSIRMMTFSFNSCRILKSELRSESDEALGAGELNVTYSDHMLVIDVFSGTERRLFDFKGPVKTQRKSIACGFEDSGPNGPIAGVVYVRLKDHQVVVYSVVIPQETRSSHLSFFHREVSPSACVDPHSDEGFAFGELEKCKHKMISALHNAAAAATNAVVFASPKREPVTAGGDDLRTNKNDTLAIATTSGGAGNATAVGANAVILPPSSAFGHDVGDDSEATDLSKTLIEHGSELKVLFQQLEKSLESNTGVKSGEASSSCTTGSNIVGDTIHSNLHPKIAPNLDDLIKEHAEVSSDHQQQCGGMQGYGGSIHGSSSSSSSSSGGHHNTTVAYKPPVDTSMDFYYTKLFDKKSPRHSVDLQLSDKEKRREREKKKSRDKKHEQNGGSSSSYKDKYNRTHGSSTSCSGSNNGANSVAKKRPGRPIIGAVKPKRMVVEPQQHSASSGVQETTDKTVVSDEIKDAISAIVTPVTGSEENITNE
ncbi:nuclear protein E36 [Elephant endotheliotropic herpesvirus 1A]|uniref:Nuclear protein E36 n=2 Tax=Elephant endotheliotropic herpesvirus 1A TaxID=759753 RepID=M1RMF5_ELHV1|nr:nuclear protein E36 [Elephant endotheliotropic herpesvirus 1A]WES72436.1 nuclear protein E36 [Elephantid betaherpesvirus 1]QOE74623.1 nuclear protein E36 [Elephant endotheliotropic herpesvirus 1A]QOE74860.1 nuclear protein E36 [Elephant endotheliotropic herpesvirus 1A]QOE74976.1 nuclear protein E36 [Elephant endotheliotropic herpesvirus 1A]